jgi:hypothetical protein
MKEEANSLFSCGCVLAVLIFNALLGSWSVNYLLLVFAGKVIPFIGALVIGLIAGEFTIPIAVIVYILKLFGVM